CSTSPRPERERGSESGGQRQTNQRHLNVVDRIDLMKRAAFIERLFAAWFLLIRTQSDRQHNRGGERGERDGKNPTASRSCDGHESFRAKPSSIFCFMR